MRAVGFAFLVTLALTTAAGPALADTPPKPGSFEEAGRLVDQLVGRVGSVGAELAQQLRGQKAPKSAEEAGRLVDQLADRLGSLGAELAQQLPPGRGGAAPMGRMGRTMGDPADRPLITIMLHHRSELGLSPEQVGRLEALRGEFVREAIRRDADIRIAELDLAALLEQEPADLAKVEAKVREVAQQRAELRIARLRAIEQGKTLLTAEQRTRLQTMLSSGMHHGPGGGHPGGPGGGSGSPPAARPAPGPGARL
jgi:Spy/CpxP family protein refolding chaperone